MAHVVDSPMAGPVEAPNSKDIEMKDTAMTETKQMSNGESGDSNLDFCTGDDFLSISHSTALVSPSGAEFDLIVKRIRGLMDEGRGECIYDIGVPLGDFGNTSGAASSTPAEGADASMS